MTLTLTKQQTDEAQPEIAKRAVLYLRAASADPQDQQSAISEQRDACTREAERLRVVIDGEYVDAGASGNEPRRAGLRALLRRIAERPVGYVIVRDRSRLARNPADDAAIRRRLEQAGATLVSAQNGAEAAIDGLRRSAR